MNAAIKVGDPVRSVATHHLGRVVEIGKYDDGATRLHVDYTTGASVSCPVDAVEPLPARPFQVGDRVRVTKHHLDGDVEVVGVVRDFQRILSDVPITMWVTLDEPKPARYKPDTTLYLSCAWVTDDHTAAHALGTDTIELIEPAPTDTSDGAVTAPTPAPSDDTTHGPLAAVLSDRTLAKVLSRPAHVPSLVALDQHDAAARLLNAAMNWEATEAAAPWEHADAEAALRIAARDYRAVTS